MFKFRYFLFAIVAIILSMSVSASDIGYTVSAEPDYAMYAGYSGFDEAIELAYTATDMEASFMGVTIESLEKLEPDKQRLNFTFTVIKPIKLAVMQNQNFDRVVFT